jgi:endonuclease G
MRLLAILAAALCFASAAAAQNASNGFTPGPHNDPETCNDLWQAIGLPQYTREDERDTTIVCHTKYVLSHNNAAKGPDWVLEHLTAEQVSGGNTRPKLKFQPDPFLPESGRAVDDDYIKSGFDRGHQAPSADFSENVDWMKESFLLSNIVPQVGAGFNRDIWATLEGHVRNLTISRGELYVITGPVYPAETGGKKITITGTENLCPNTIVLDLPPRAAICGGKPQCQDGVTVPSAMFKLIYDPGTQRANVFLMPNINHRGVAGFSNSMDYVKRYQVTVRALEGVVHLDFFPAVSASKRRPIESQCAGVMN